MATINLGRIKPVFRGAYSGATAYVIDDIVTSGDETFICILASTGNATSNATYWTKLAAKGTDGTDVGTTITTQGDILYRDGSGLQRLAKGTARQGLQTNSGATAPEWVDTPQSLMTAQGDILYASSANTPAKLAKGSAAQALVMNAGATAPEWATAGGGLTLITRTKLGSATATVNFDQSITSAYTIYKAIITYKLDTDGAYIQMRFREGGSGSESDLSGSTDYRYINEAFTDSGGNDRGNRAESNKFHLDNASGNHLWNNVDLNFHIPYAGGSGSRASWNGQGFMYRDSGSYYFVNTLGGYYESTDTPTGFSFGASTGNLEADTEISLFGYKQ